SGILFFTSRRRHTRSKRDWSSDVCSSDLLIARIAAVRTWTFITHRGDWLEDADGWRDTTRTIEDRLSDALHERLTQRFVDRRTEIGRASCRERGASCRHEG